MLCLPDAWVWDSWFADDGVRFTLDGQLVGESLNPDTVNMVSSTLNLTAGSHPIRLDYFQRGGGKAFEFGIILKSKIKVSVFAGVFIQNLAKPR